MFESFLAVLLPGFNLVDFQPQAEAIVITARAASPSSPCPSCNVLSKRVHSYYSRRPKDLPLAGQPLRLVLQVRRFRCLNPACRAATFAERLPQLVAPTAQRTTRLNANLRILALALGGEAGARYAIQSAIEVSPDSLLRLLKQTVLPIRPTPRVLAVDDFALRKGHIYGTLLVDGETHRPVELLADRTAASLAQWLGQNQGVEIITRDRSTEYTRGASEGAPQAIQIADRWHLLTNLREALERVLDRLRPELQKTLTFSLAGPSLLTEPAPISMYDREIRRGTKDQLTQQTRRARRYELYRQVKELQQKGHNLHQVARELKLGLRRVRRYFASEQFPEQARPPRAKSILDPYVPYLQQAWDSGCHKNVELYHQLQQQGYTGSIRPVVQWTILRRERANGGPTGKGRFPTRQIEIIPAVEMSAAKLPASRRLVWSVILREEKLKESEQQLIQMLKELPAFDQLYQLGQQFVAMVRERNSAALKSWLEKAQTSQLAELASFARGLKREEASIEAALKYAYSNGVAEGHVNRLKMIKRTMYGRASFELLRKRVLAA